MEAGGSFSGTKSQLTRPPWMPVLEPPPGDTDPFIFSSCLRSTNSYPSPQPQGSQGLHGLLQQQGEGFLLPAAIESEGSVFVLGCPAGFFIQHCLQDLPHVSPRAASSL